MEYRLTITGKRKIEQYIRELEATRKDILDAGIDTADYTDIPTVEDIFEDAIAFGVDDDGDTYNSWAVTDNYDADNLICLTLGIDFEEV